MVFILVAFIHQIKINFRISLLARKKNVFKQTEIFSSPIFYQLDQTGTGNKLYLYYIIFFLALSVPALEFRVE